MEKLDVSETEIIVSVVMPVYNEEKYMDSCIQSLLNQDYPHECMEWLFIDGSSTDNTINVIKYYKKQNPKLIKVYDNPQRTVPYAMNIGIKAAKGRYIIRLDAHAEYASDYISKCVYYLENTDAENVGGVAETKSKGFVGDSIALMLSSKFGVGNSQFRINGKSGYVDTVPFGAFKKEVFEKYGLYDERLTRNQDNEMNYRIRKNAGKIYMASDIHLAYYCRDSIKGIVDMAIKNGKWNVITYKICPGAMGVRHFIPLLFLLSIIFLPIISIIFPMVGLILKLELILYLVLNILFAIKQATKLKYIPMLFILFPTFHISYGIGSILGIFTNINEKKSFSFH